MRTHSPSTGFSTPAWDGLRGRTWRDRVDVRTFLLDNITPYTGDGAFLEGPTERSTHRLATGKHECLGLPYPLADVEPPDDATIARVRQRFEQHGVMAV